MVGPQPISYQPQFQAPTWKDNVDPILAGGPNGFNIQFQNLRAELDMLSGIIKQLSDQINSVSQTANTANTTATTAQTAANAATSAANTANTTATTAQTAANAATSTANTANTTATSAQTAANTAQTAANKANNAIQAIMWGCIAYDGSLWNTSGNFTVTHSGPGLYDISFKSPFALIPAVQAIVLYPGGDPTSPGGDPRYNAVVVGVTTSQCRIKTGDQNGNAADLNFSFIAYCPPA